LSEIVDLAAQDRASQNPDMMLFIARHALTWIVHEAICDRQGWLTDPAFREELVALLMNFLRAD
jgi:hypothetical protein